MESHIYIPLAENAPIRVTRKPDDIVAVWFGDEGFIVEMAEGIVPRLVQALTADG